MRVTPRRSHLLAAWPHSAVRLVVEGVSFTYPSGAEPALRDVSLEVHQGEVVAPVG
ncbi:MAG TPA: hypothetical protein VE664_04545 [Actinomycetes bacterium]|jgi:ABC-type transport system involved in cytochrome bd biosynthesis fused ATPase/permease subunit|nr:hypothetical protein [Actinomycetes bacterium]